MSLGSKLHNYLTSLDNEKIHTSYIINNQLKWDGSHLGDGMIMSQWVANEVNYYSIAVIGGTVYCKAKCSKDMLPCIIEDIKSVFGIVKRGIHRITIDNDEYIIYYVTISNFGDILYESPLKHLDIKHELYQDMKFRRQIQKILVFCDILVLNNTEENYINNDLQIINTNDTTLITQKSYNSRGYDYTILSRTMFFKWFGEEVKISDVAKEMIYDKSDINEMTFTLILADIRNKIDNIIKRYDGQYIWYSYFIMDRLSRYLSNDM